MEEGSGEGPAAPLRFNWHRDLLSSIVVFLVALPLCMGIAIASGAPVAAGLATGIIGGLVVGVLAGSPLQVSGPAAGLTVIVLGIVQQQGMETLGLVGIVAGLVQLTAGLTGIGQWFRAVSPAVVEGMLAGIGILIFASQFHVMVDSAPHNHGLENITELPDAVRKGLPWPETTSQEQRATQRDWLRKLVVLHADQKQLQAEVDRRRAAVQTNAVQINDDEQASPEHYENLFLKQQDLVARLNQDIAAAAQLTDAQLDSDLRTRLQSDLAAAAKTSAAALADLEQGRGESISKSQLAATKTLASACNGMKDHATAGKLGLLTIAVMLIWQALPWKRIKVIPAPLLAVTLATVVAFLLASPVLYVDVPQNILNDLHFPTLTQLRSADWQLVVQMGFVVALVASAETLLCCSAVDQMHQGPRTKYNRELAAQGVGNLLCGLICALPMTGVIVRSATNVQAGATSRMSAILHGVWLLVFVLLLTWLLRMIPTASLAAMLVYTGVRLVNITALRHFWKLDKFEAAIFVITALVIVVDHLLTGVIVGILLAAAKLLWQFSYLKVAVQPAENGKPIVVSLRGAATFLRLPQLAQKLEKISAKSHVKLVIDHLTYIDHACLELIVHWRKRHQAAGGEVEIDMEELANRYRRRPLDPSEA